MKGYTVRSRRRYTRVGEDKLEGKVITRCVTRPIGDRKRMEGVRLVEGGASYRQERPRQEGPTGTEGTRMTNTS